MGLSVVISGAIMMVALMFVLYSIPTLLNSITSVGETSSEISALENTILQTEISLDTLAANSSATYLTFNLNNINIEKLWNYDEFDIIVTYDADVAGTKTRVTDIIPFNIVNQSYTILAEEVTTAASASAGAAYANIYPADLNANVNVVGPDSHILFHTNIAFEDSAGSDCSARVALFIDGVMVAEAEDFSDDNAPEEPGNIGLTWWETGLAAGAHDFDVRWLDQQQDCTIETGTEQSMQVIEFTPGDGVPIILTEVTSLTGESYPTTYSPITGMRDSPSVNDPDSLLLTSGTVSYDEDGTGDASCYLGIFIDGVLQAEQQTFTDHEQFGSSAGIIWGESGLSAGSHTFELQAREDQTGCGIETDMQRHMQVVEYVSGDPTILAEDTCCAAFQDFGAAYANIVELDPGPIAIDGPGSLVLFTATVTFDTNPATSEGDLGLFIDNVLVAEGRTYIEALSNEPGHVTLHWWETGLSAGNHDFEVRAKDGDQPGARTDTETQSHIQVIEFPCTKQWNIANISNDILDPGILNPEESAKILVGLCNPIFDSGNVVVSVSTDKGVSSTISGTAT